MSYLPLFSLIVATVDRTSQIERLFNSFAVQTCKNFECILVDQNVDDRLVPLITTFQDHFPIFRLHSPRGLSRARNVGLRTARGSIIAFPDDDCWYPINTLKRVANLFETNHTWDGITGIANSGTGKVSQWRFDNQMGVVNRSNVWSRGISFSIFLRSAVIKQVGDFDERLGVGSIYPWKSGEESDYLLRAIQKNFLIQFVPELVVYHKDDLPDFRNNVKKAYDYGMGMGFVLGKHRYHYLYSLAQCIRPLGAAIKGLMLLDPYRACYFFASAFGRYKGWQDWRNSLGY